MIAVSPLQLRLFLSAAVLGAAALLSGCATITRGTTESFKVDSIPAGAQVRLDTGETGITPATFTVPRKKDLVVTVSKDGFQPLTQTVTTKMAGRGAAGLAGNALIGGVIGIGVDAVTGATLNHYPNPLVVQLQPVGAPVASSVVTPEDKPATATPAEEANAAEKPAGDAASAPPPK